MRCAKYDKARQQLRAAAIGCGIGDGYLCERTRIQQIFDRYINVIGPLAGVQVAVELRKRWLAQLIKKLVGPQVGREVLVLDNQLPVHLQAAVAEANRLVVIGLAD